MDRIWVGVWSWLPPPIWNSENEQGWQVLHWASAAAIFIGWYLASITPSSSPTSMVNKMAGTRTMSASRADRVNTSRSAAVPQLPRGHRQHHPRAGDQRRQQHLRISPDEHLVGEHGPDVVQLRLAVHHDVADGMLHPGVGRHDERRRQDAAQRDQPDRQQVYPPGQPVPAEQPQPQERGLQEERGQPLHGQRRAEDVADQPRVGRPVHPELELLHQAGDHADRHVDDQQDAEEPGQPQVLVALAAVPGGLQQRGQEGQADRDRHEKEVIDRHKRELPPRKIDVRHLLPRSAIGSERLPADVRARQPACQVLSALASRGAVLPGGGAGGSGASWPGPT